MRCGICLMRGAGVYAVPGFWSSLMQVRSLSCVVVDLLVKECNWFTSSTAPRHSIVAYRKHVFAVFRNPRPDFVGKGLLSTFRSGSQGSRNGYALSTFLRAESCLVSCICSVSGGRGLGGSDEVDRRCSLSGVGRGNGECVRCRVMTCFLQWAVLVCRFPCIHSVLVLRSFFCSFIALPYPFSWSCYPEAGFLAFGAGGCWSISPLFVALSTPTTVQSYYFIYCVAYCCHPVPCLFDVGLLDKVNLPVPHRI
jgi:hypothetical protein